MDFNVDSFTWNVDSEWTGTNGLQDLVGLSRSGIIRNSHWSFRDENEDDDDEEDSSVPDLSICTFFNRWIEGKKLNKKKRNDGIERAKKEDKDYKWLHNWTIRILSRREASLLLIGQRASSADPKDMVDESYIAGCVVEVQKPDLIRTTKGTFSLVGNLINPRNEIPALVRKPFHKGFPSTWKDVVSRNWRSNTDGSSSDESICYHVDVESKTKLPKKAVEKAKKPPRKGYLKNSIECKKVQRIEEDVNPKACKNEEISLVNWTLGRDPVEGFTLSGYLHSSTRKNEVIQAGRILSRISPYKIKTELGIFILKGAISNKDMCLPESIKSKFATKFPHQWKRLLDSCWNNASRTNAINIVSSDEEALCSEKSQGVKISNGSPVLAVKHSQPEPTTSKNGVAKKRKAYGKSESKSKKNIASEKAVYDSLDESVNISSEEEAEELTEIKPIKKRGRKENETNVEGNTGTKTGNKKKCIKATTRKEVKPAGTRKVKESAGTRKVKEISRKRQSICVPKKSICNGKQKKNSKSRNTKKTKEKQNEKTNEKEPADDVFNASFGDAFAGNGNASLFSSFVAGSNDGIFGSASFKDFSLGKVLLSAKKSKSRQNGAETPPLKYMDFEFFKNTTTSTHSVNSTISNEGNDKATQEITKRVKKLNKSSPKQSKKARKTTKKAETRVNRDVDDLLQQMMATRKGCSTPKLVKHVFRPRTPGDSDRDSWDSDS